MNNQQGVGYKSYVDARLTQIQKYVLAHKINNEKNKILENQLEQQRRRIDNVQERMRWLEMSMNTSYDQSNLISRKVEKMATNIESVKKFQVKVNDLFQNIEQTYKKYIQQSDIQTFQAKLIGMMKIQLSEYQSKINYLEEQISYLQFYLAKIQDHRESPISMSSITLPTQLLVTKKELRQNIELIQQIYSKKIRKMDKKIKSIKNNSKVNKVESKFDDYDLSKHRRSQQSESNNSLNFRSLMRRKNENENRKMTEISFKRMQKLNDQNKSNSVSKRGTSLSLKNKKKRRRDSNSPYSMNESKLNKIRERI